MSTPRYSDCESCAFYRVEDAVCDMCHDADQWEPDDPNALFNSLNEPDPKRIPFSGKAKRFKVMKVIKLKEAA